MKRNCSLELRLLPPSDSLSSALHCHHHSSPENQQKQQLTIFYDGRVCVCDVTELQARAILMIAGREMEEKMRSPSSSGSPPPSSSGSPPPQPPVSPSIESQLYSPATALSMKRSLQRFLQKRKHRVLAASPY